jgi:3-phosphoshikimate 1-carboxyvinyltransferase
LENVIKVFPKATVEPKEMTVESDWSSASYFFSLVLVRNGLITLSSYKETSLQEIPLWWKKDGC